MNNKEIYTRYALELTKKTNNKATLPDIEELNSISRRLHRLDENSCNGYSDFQGNWNEEAEKKAEKRELRLEKRAETIASQWGAKIYRQGDPRGWSLYIVFPGDIPQGEDVGAYYNRGVGVPVR